MEAQLAARTDGTIAAVMDRADELVGTGRAVTIGGLLTEVQVRTTRAGQPYARVVLEDLGGSLEIILSARAFASFSGFLAKDNVVLIKGRLDHRDEDVRFSAIDVTLLHADPASQELRLSLGPTDLTQSGIAALREVLSRYPGTSPVVVEVTSGKAFRLGPEFNVNIASVVGDLRTEFGRNVIKA